MPIKIYQAAVQHGIHRQITKRTRGCAHEAGQCEKRYSLFGRRSGMLGAFRRVQPVSLYILRARRRLADCRQDAALGRCPARLCPALRPQAYDGYLPFAHGRALAAGLCACRPAALPVHLSRGHRALQLRHSHGTAKPQRCDDGAAYTAAACAAARCWLCFSPLAGRSLSQHTATLRPW